MRAVLIWFRRSVCELAYAWVYAAPAPATAGFAVALTLGVWLLHPNAPVIPSLVVIITELINEPYVGNVPPLPIKTDPLDAVYPPDTKVPMPTNVLIPLTLTTPPPIDVIVDAVPLLAVTVEFTAKQSCIFPPLDEMILLARPQNLSTELDDAADDAIEESERNPVANALVAPIPCCTLELNKTHVPNDPPIEFARPVLHAKISLPEMLPPLKEMTLLPLIVVAPE